MVECFCGCGRSVPFRRRSANALGPKVARELDDWHAISAAMKPGTEGAEGVKAFVDEGEQLYASLQASVHNEPVDPGFSNRRAASWLRFSQRSRSGLGRHAVHHAIEHRLGLGRDDLGR
jgi:hypothetical protein